MLNKIVLIIVIGFAIIIVNSPIALAHSDVNVINVKASPYLATGNGTTNDQPAIQSAINSLNGKRGIVFFPPGNYYCTADIDANRAVLVGSNPPGTSGGGGTTILFTAVNSTAGIYSSVTDNFGYEVRDLKIVGSNNSIINTAQVLLDFTGQNYPRVSNVRLWYSGVGILLAGLTNYECHYGLFNRVDINACWIGVKCGDAAGLWPHSQTFISGRFFYNHTAVLLPANLENINFIGTAFEYSHAYDVNSSAASIDFTGCRFETPDSNNIHLYIHKGAGKHFLNGNFWSSGKAITDENKYSVIYGTDSPLENPISASFVNQNLIRNGSFEYDPNADGKAEDWRGTFSSGGVGTWSLSTDAQDGTYSQKIVTTTGQTTIYAYQYITTEPNVPLVVRFRYKCDAGTTYLRIGNGTYVNNYTYLNRNLINDNNWREYRYYIAPTTKTVNFTIELNGAVARTALIDDVVINAGILAPTGPLVRNITEAGGTVYGNIGFYGKTPPAQPTIAAATGTLADITTKFNTLLTYLKSRGDIK